MPKREILKPTCPELLMCNWLENFTGKRWKLLRDKHWTIGGYFVRLGTGTKHIDVYIEGDHRDIHQNVTTWVVVHVDDPDSGKVEHVETNVDIYTDSKTFLGDNMTIGSETTDEFKTFIMETGKRLGLIKSKRKESKMNMMRTWAIWGTVYATGEPLETLEIDAESFDDALNIARTVHPDYCAGQVIG